MIPSILKSEVALLLQRMGVRTSLTKMMVTPVSGLTGFSWHLSDGYQQWLLRVSSAEKWRQGVIPGRERLILQKVKSLRIAPRLLGGARHGEWLLLEWLKGSMLSAQNWKEADVQSEVGKILAVLHHQPLMGYSFDLRQQLSRYWQYIDRGRLSPAWLRVQRWAMCSALPVPVKLAPVHMDVHAGNIIRTPEGLRLIDWEYAVDADIALEFALLFLGNNLSAVQQEVFLHSYCVQGGYSDLQRLMVGIRHWFPWVNYLMLMWYELRWQQTRDPVYLELGSPLWRTVGLH